MERRAEGALEAENSPGKTSEEEEQMLLSKGAAFYSEREKMIPPEPSQLCCFEKVY